MKRQHSRLHVIMASESGFDLALNGVISIPRSELSNLANASFIDLQNPSLTKPEDGSTRDPLRYDYNLDMVLSPSDVAALRRVVLQVCLEKPNVYIVSGFPHKICILWRHATSRSEFDGDLLGPVQRSWSFEQARVEIEHRKSMGYDDDSISQEFAKYYREYR